MPVQRATQPQLADQSIALGFIRPCGAGYILSSEGEIDGVPADRSSEGSGDPRRCL